VTRQLAALVEEARPTHVLGHSMGGIIALALAAEMPGRFEAVGLVGLPVFVDRDDGRRFLRARPVHNMFLRRDRLSHVGCVAMHRTGPLWLPFSRWVLPRQPRSVLRTTFHHSREGHVGGLNAVVFAGHVPALASRVGTPVFALHGAADRSAPLERVRQLVATQGWELRVADGCGHQVVVERPGVVGAWVRGWLHAPAERPVSLDAAGA
jgi:pimeloyl-ACP methyl ester carboxylesterase